MACDICGKTGTTLNDLRGIYQTEHIKAICPECEQVVNKKLSAIQIMLGLQQRDLLKRFLQMLRIKAQENNHG